MLVLVWSFCVATTTAACSTRALRYVSRVVEGADHHGATLVVHAPGLVDVLDDHDVGHVGLLGPLDQRLLDRPERREDRCGPRIAAGSDRAAPAAARVRSSRG